MQSLNSHNNNNANYNNKKRQKKTIERSEPRRVTEVPFPKNYER